VWKYCLTKSEHAFDILVIIEANNYIALYLIRINLLPVDVETIIVSILFTIKFGI